VKNKNPVVSEKSNNHKQAEKKGVFHTNREEKKSFIRK